MDMINQYIAQVADLFRGFLFWAVFLSWVTSQLLKSAIAFVQAPQGKRVQYFFAKFGVTGGMPSSHSATVCSLALALGLKSGFNTDTFMVAVVGAVVVMRDAVGVRLSNGVQAKTLNALGKNVSEKLGVRFKPVREINGHKPIEVFVGAIIGTVITIICKVLID